MESADTVAFATWKEREGDGRETGEGGGEGGEGDGERRRGGGEGDGERRERRGRETGEEGEGDGERVNKMGGGIVIEVREGGIDYSHYPIYDMDENKTFQKRLLGLQRNLYNFAYQLTTNREQAEDLLQDTTLKALNNESKYVDNVNFKGWLFTIMRHIFINNYRQTVRAATIIDTTQDLYHLNVSQVSAADTPEDSFAVKEINEALEGFSEEFREPFNMYIAGYKYSEIAEKMGLPLGTIKSRIFSTRKRLREMLKD